MPKYCISGLIIEVTAPDWALHEDLRPFQCNTGETDVYCNIVFQKQPARPGEEVKIIADTLGTLIYEFQDIIHNLCGDDQDIPSYTFSSKDWAYHTMFIEPEYNNPNDNIIVQAVREGISAALRDVTILALIQRRGLIIHSSTILWNGEGVMFSAPSGTGKSTHTRRWRELYDTPILDGDTTACRIVNGIPIVYGLPWCGTSGEFINSSAPLRAIVFLQQAKENNIKRLDSREAILRLIARCFLRPWSHEVINQYLDTVQEIAEKIECYLLDCLPDSKAVELVKKCLEKN
ncbi:hypothetical protein UNSWDHB_1041 [Dehalobacter sp. UNSWDHB]|uniref:hypothetical protein n=1 Tax=Dehalobacter sp. UNSWDHB TaxID=1339256 RepID=UPI00038DB9F1|nr:hypothetical protein [Dehalobacter sp. UNSWDHB]EQB21628.1 hypothetical protein UNSWDHB_1041 [Dehalobacter sp. UNSWDHB]